jgi:hypothetical protein
MLGGALAGGAEWPTYYKRAPFAKTAKGRPPRKVFRAEGACHTPAPRMPRQRTPHSGEVRHLRRHAGMHRGRVAGVVDHVVDGAEIAERHGDDVVEADLRALRRLDGAG